MAGRKKDPIWLYFNEEATISGKGTKANCKKCGTQMMGIVSRMKKHRESCLQIEITEDELKVDPRNEENTNIAEIDCPSQIAATKTSSSISLQSSSNCHNQVKRKASFDVKEHLKIKPIDAYVFKTSKDEKKCLDKQVARFIYATNSSFRCVEHKEFNKMVSALRPGYTPPSRKQIAGVLLNDIYEEEKAKCAELLSGQTVSVGLDGWSNVSNEPLICATATTSSGDLYLVSSIDTSGNPHTTEYLVKLAKEIILKCETEFNCSVRSLVTDNANNVKSMRSQLGKDNQLQHDLITYGCTAHLIHLLAKDLNVPNVKEQIVHVAKYFRNNHFASAKYKQEGGTMLILPQDVRWNTMFYCLERYLTNWPALMKICEESRNKIDDTVYKKVTNFNLKRSAEDLMGRLKPITAALEQAQKKNCLISEAVAIWKKLETDLKALNLGKENMIKFETRYGQALSACHFLSYLIDPRFCGKDLSANEKKEALLFAKENYCAKFLPIIMKFLAKADPFHDFLFDCDVVNTISPLQWWKSHSSSKGNGIDVEVEIAITQLLTAIASSASVERIFSTYGLVQSELRNRLDNEKAGKLVFLFKCLNS